MGSDLKFLTNNANWLKSTKKRLNLFEYYRDKRGTTNSCGPMIGYLVPKSFAVHKMSHDTSW